MHGGAQPLHHTTDALAMGVGCAFAGLFFGWNLGLARGGTLGLGLALVVVAILYLTFTLSYAELACAIPRAGGVMSYVDRALGRSWGLLPCCCHCFSCCRFC
jgi:ethanolamine permease